ncbi:MAG: hypothetical protein AAFX41_14845, partial [Bacteroidota bacterium]
AFVVGALKAPVLLLWRSLDYVLILVLGTANTAATVQHVVASRVDGRDPADDAEMSEDHAEAAHKEPLVGNR